MFWPECAFEPILRKTKDWVKGGLEGETEPHSTAFDLVMLIHPKPIPLHFSPRVITTFSIFLVGCVVNWISRGGLEADYTCFNPRRISN